MVPFNVPCGRCGEKLNGLAQPQCPKCDLELVWDDLLPVEDMHCPHCDYLVYGATRERCTECGAVFAWDDVLGAAQSRRNSLFEHFWTRRPVASLLRTWWLAAMKPRRLWAEFSIHDSPKVAPLLVFMLLQWAVFAYGWDTVARVVDPAINAASRWVYERDWLDRQSLTPQPQSFTYSFRPGTDFLKFTACWYVLTFLSFQAFVQTKARYRIRWRQILRVFVHGTAFVSLATAVWCVAEAAVDASLLVNPGWGRFVARLYNPLGQGTAIVGAVVTWAHIWIGYHCYLKTPRGWGTAAMCLILGHLLTQLLWIYI